MATVTKPMTVEEFSRLPDSGTRMELRHGVLVTMPPAKLAHHLLQNRIRRVVESALLQPRYVATEFPFRPSSEFEVWIADVAAIDDARLKTREAVEGGYFLGSPELIIEVLSPSNSMSEMLDREQTCRAGGCIEFWVVDPQNQLVKVTGRDGLTRTFSAGQAIASEFLDRLPVNELFA